MELVVKMLYGSRIYGTNDENSDTDYKAIILPSKEDCFTDNILKGKETSTGNDLSKNTKDDVDYGVYSLQYFISMACQGKSEAMAMLHAPEECIIESSWIWDTLVANRDKFYTRNVTKAIEYAETQANKYGVKGSRLKAVEDTLAFLETLDPNDKLLPHIDKLPLGKWAELVPEENSDIIMYKVCDRSYQTTAKVGYVRQNIRKVVCDYGNRARKARTNDGLDWAALSHAVRVGLTTVELLREGTITYPLAPELANTVRSIKQGKTDYNSVIVPLLKGLRDEIKDMAMVSTLPEKVDRQFWNDWIVSIYNGMDNRKDNNVSSPIHNTNSTCNCTVCTCNDTQ